MVLPTVVMRLKEYKNELKKVDPESSSSKAKNGSFGNNSPLPMTSEEYFPSLVGMGGLGLVPPLPFCKKTNAIPILTYVETVFFLNYWLFMSPVSIL